MATKPGKTEYISKITDDMLKEDAGRELSDEELIERIKLIILAKGELEKLEKEVSQIEKKMAVVSGDAGTKDISTSSDKFADSFDVSRKKDTESAANKDLHSESPASYDELTNEAIEENTSKKFSPDERNAAADDLSIALSDKELIDRIKAILKSKRETAVLDAEAAAIEEQEKVKPKASAEDTTRKAIAGAAAPEENEELSGTEEKKAEAAPEGGKPAEHVEKKGTAAVEPSEKAEAEAKKAPLAPETKKEAELPAKKSTAVFETDTAAKTEEKREEAAPGRAAHAALPPAEAISEQASAAAPAEAAAAGAQPSQPKTPEKRNGFLQFIDQKISRRAVVIILVCELVLFIIGSAAFMIVEKKAEEEQARHRARISDLYSSQINAVIEVKTIAAGRAEKERDAAAKRAKEREKIAKIASTAAALKYVPQEEGVSGTDIENSITYKTVQGAYTWSGAQISKSAGSITGPLGRETYYNLNMSTIVSMMHGRGVGDSYWVRSDGCKMLGNYIMVAANLSVHPRGSIVKSSRGLAMVCDTGGFAAGNPNQLDIATTW